MEYFEFLYGSKIICLPLNISEKLCWQHLFEKLEEVETHSLHLLLIWYNTHTLKNNIYHLNKQGPPTFFHSDINPVLGHVLVHSDDKTHVVVVTVELIWLMFFDKLSFNFTPAPNKSRRFTRFRKSFVNRPAVALIKVTLLFCLMCAVQSGHVPYFCSCLSSMILHLRNLFLLSTPVARMLLTPR